MSIQQFLKTCDPSDNRIRRPYMIAEAGVNHEGSLETARRLIAGAKEGGADAVKFQTYKAERLASRKSPAYWDTTKEPAVNQYQLFKKYDRFWKEEFEALKKYCDREHIEFLSTPFDFESADFLNDLMGAFKISSSDLTNKPLIEHVCGFGKPVLLSTGASCLEEIHEAVSWVKQAGNDLILLHCVLNYPTEEENAGLGMICGLKQAFPEHLIGYSDHTLPRDMKVLETAVLLGAVVIEKHFTHDKSLPGNDHYHAMDKNDLKVFFRGLNRILSLIGQYDVVCLASEEISRLNARRSLVASRPIKKGEMFTSNNITAKRPGTGLPPKDFTQVLGKPANKDYETDDLIG